MQQQNSEFELRGLNHCALVSEDMQRTVDFYSGVLGMPLVKTIDLPGGLGQHFFFDMGGGNELAFFWFRDAAEPKPGIASAANLVGSGNGTITSAHGSMNHVAFAVAPDKIEQYRGQLVAKGVD